MFELEAFLFASTATLSPSFVGRVDVAATRSIEGGLPMLSIEECKKYIGDLDLTDKQIEEVRDILSAFVEQALDYVTEEGIVCGTEKVCQPTIRTKE